MRTEVYNGHQGNAVDRSGIKLLLDVRMSCVSPGCIFWKPNLLRVGEKFRRSDLNLPFPDVSKDRIVGSKVSREAPSKFRYVCPCHWWVHIYSFQ